MVMSINPSIAFASHTVVTPTDAMQRDNQQREAISQVSQNEAFHRERGIGAGAEKAPLAESFANQLGKARQTASQAEKSLTGEPLSDEDKEKVKQLKTRDAEVRKHEQAHASIGGQYAGSPSYEMEQGPDGRSYAVGGEVSIDVTPIANDPAATIQKMQIVRRAALGVDEPSPADRNIANTATQEEAKARQALAEEEKLAQTDEPKAVEQPAEQPTVQPSTQKLAQSSE